MHSFMKHLIAIKNCYLIIAINKYTRCFLLRRRLPRPSNEYSLSFHFTTEIKKKRKGTCFPCFFSNFFTKTIKFIFLISNLTSFYLHFSTNLSKKLKNWSLIFFHCQK